MGEQIRDWVEEFSPAVEVSLSLPDRYGIEHKWTKKNIFWELEYWSTHLIRHNLDVMHIKKNVFDNIFNTVMDIKGKTKDNLNAGKDLKIICNRPELEVDERRPNVMPKAVYTLTREQKMRICEWITRLKSEVKNKAHVEESIVEAYLVEEISIFTFQCFEPRVLCKRNKPSRNDDLAMNDTLTPYNESFLNELYKHYDSEDPIIEELVGTQFKDWFKRRVKDETNYTGNEPLKLHYWGPTAEVTTFPYYFVIGYNFHSVGKSTFNCGVCVKSSSYTDTDSDLMGFSKSSVRDRLYRQCVFTCNDFPFRLHCRDTPPVPHGRGRGRGPTLPTAASDASWIGGAVCFPSPPLATTPPSAAPQTPDDAGPSAGASASEDAGMQSAVPAAAPVPPPPPVPPLSARQYISLDDASLIAVVRGHFPHPWPCLRQVPAEHQHFWFESMKITYWWDCDDESMFRVFHMFVEKYIRKNSPSPGPTWSSHYGWPMRSGLATGVLGRRGLPARVLKE
ncbi:UNVERIFIED_CONTAM: hypothetical protein Slati_1775400 [Sesamum latifolium]|uniref:DUF4218 domain-containing protein n=1 Tax=Sesamum latifolium TaxID=2727402 RepID=A0AAW2X2J6_9LAMI